MKPPQGTISLACARPEYLAARAQRDPAVVKHILQGLDSDKAPIRFGCAKALRVVAVKRPEVLYPYFSFFVRLLDHKNKILQWEGAIVLSHLARVDVDEKFGPVFRKYFSPITGPVMITAANVIGGSSRIARAKPALADRIAAEVLKVKNARYATAECRNVAIGHALTALDGFFDLLHNPASAIAFARSQLKNRRPATRKKAERLLKRILNSNLP